jgi:16S rRNA (adenine1518-N6/adenine1519-N6)-dimethyltransferase
LRAAAGCYPRKAYAALACWWQSLTDVTLVRQLPPSVFWPRPLVSSAIVLIVPNAAKRAHVGDVHKLRNFLRDLYVHRRKNLRGALAGSPRGRVEKPEVDRKLAELGLEGTSRAEELDLEQHLKLCAASLHAWRGEWGLKAPPSQPPGARGGS